VTWWTSLRECCSCTPEDSSWASCDVLLGYRTTGYAKGLSSDLLDSPWRNDGLSPGSHQSGPVTYEYRFSGAHAQ
jgi:hypothetical protein